MVADAFGRNCRNGRLLVTSPANPRRFPRRATNTPEYHPVSLEQDRSHEPPGFAGRRRRAMLGHIMTRVPALHSLSGRLMLLGVIPAMLAIGTIVALATIGQRRSLARGEERVLASGASGA